jgi:hypothetical protein
MRLSLNYEEKEPIFWRVFEEISNAMIEAID